MGTPPDPLSAVAIVAADPHKRASLAAALAGVARPKACGFHELAAQGGLVDATATIAVLDAASAEAEVDALAQLRDAGAGQHLILVSQGIDDAFLAGALERLGAAAWLPDPTPSAALQSALRRLTAGRDPGKGGRIDHRSTRTIVGVSKAIRDVLGDVARVAPTRLSVLILGETGTGKELIARAIHEQSARSSRPFVAVNCGALPEALLEAELFGATEGAFTGATRDRQGLFEQADGGTLFLDEIGETTAALQVKLLRALEEGEIRPVGGSRALRVDVRIVCATHRELGALIEAGGFRQDLFYRINAATLYLPPLRRRRVDIPFLAQHFAEEFGETHARRVVLDEQFLRALEQQELPGNVRELRNLIERAIALTRPGEPVATELRSESEPAEPPSSGAAGMLQPQVDALERRLIRDALQRYDGNRTRVAEALGMSRQGLRNRMARHQIE